MKKVFLIALMAICFSQVITAQNNAKIDVSLQQEMALSQTTDLIRVNIILNRQYEQMEMRMKTSVFPTKAAKRSFVVSELQRFSEETQQGVMNLLSAMPAVSEVQSFWIANFINCYANIEAIEELSLHPDVLVIGFDKEEQLIPDGGTRIEENPTREIVANVLKVQANLVWELGFKGEGIVVAVLDTGVNYDHHDLRNHMWEHPDYPYHGWNYVSNSNNPKDDNGHGTHCAGTVAGDGSAGSQTGMAPEAQIMALKVMNNQGSGSLSQMLNGIQFAVDKGADVISMSLGFKGGGDNSVRVASRNAMINVLEAGLVAAVSAGNEGTELGTYPIPNNIGCPGNCPPPWMHPDQTTTGGTSAVMCVGATNNNDASANFSSRGPVTWQSVSTFNDYPYSPGMGLLRPDICAPGVNIKSLSYTNNTGYLQGMEWSGTSMAAPCVAGVIALMLSKNPALLPEEICEIIETTAVHLPNASSPKGNTFGSGRVNALAAINTVPEYIEDLVLEGVIINDAETGNNNGRLNPGETVGLTVTLKDVLGEPINNVQVTFKTSNSFVTIVNGTANFGNFAANETKTIEDAFTITLSNEAPPAHIIKCTLEATANGITRKIYFQITVYDFILNLLDVKVANSTGEVGVGETSDIWVYVKNTGNEIASNVTTKISSSSPYLIINDKTTESYGHIYNNQYKYRTYNITIAPETPSSTTYVPLTVTITEESGKSVTANTYFRFKNIGQPPQSCNAVTNLSVEIAASNAILTWTAPSGSAPEKYLVYCNDLFLGETTATTYTQNIVGGKYHFCVEPMYDNGCTGELSCTEASLPCAVTVALTMDSAHGEEFHLSWLPVLEDATFRIYKNAEILTELKGNEYVDTEIEFYTSYCYTIVVVCPGNLESDHSNEVCETPVGINELGNDIKIYPNPVTGELQVTSYKLQVTGIEIFDVMGRKQKAESRKQNVVDIAHLPNGVYFLKITTENGVVTKKIIKN